jgi:GGDEF domain-containing protein
MKKHSSFRITLELIFFSTIIVVINFFFRQDAGFFGVVVNPYIALALLAGAYYGRYYGIASVFISAFLIAVPLSFTWELLYPKTLTEMYWRYLGDEAIIPSSIALIGAFFIGSMRDSLYKKYERVKTLLSKISREKGVLKKELQGLKITNRELEKRLSTQKDSIISLYLRIQGLYTLNMKNSLGLILSTVQRFTGATSCSIWEYVPEYKQLTLRLSAGWENKTDSATVITVDNSIEGWVVRNNMIFTVKMVLQYDNLRKLDTGRNIYTAPMLSGHKIWGVLNIERIPFEKYNLYTEKLLLMILALAAPAIERAIEYETFMVKEPLNPITGLPPFSQFYVYLEKEVNRMIVEKGSLSIIIVETTNYPDIVSDLGKEKIFKLMLEMAEDIKQLSGGKTVFFHYKSDNQFSLLYPNLDFDGCSVFCLQILETLNQKEYTVDGLVVKPEAILGYASLGEKDNNAKALIDVAENLLEMQKI